jgi:hypothetical protein
MRGIRPRLLLLTLAMLALPAVAWPEDQVPEVRALAAPAIVKIKGKGTTSAGREVPIEGSGVVVSTLRDVSVIVTSAHVLGKIGTWRLTQSGEPELTLEVWTLDPSGALEPLALPPTVVAQDDANDFAVLIVHGKRAALRIGNPLDLAGGSQVLALGYPIDSYDLALDDGRAQLQARPDQGLVLQLSDMQTTGGQSGGPILDLQGRVLGILSGALRQRTGTDLAVPITTIQPKLAAYLPPTLTGSTATRDTVVIEGSARLELFGNGGGDFARSIRTETYLTSEDTASQPSQSGSDVSVAARGGERSECREDSGRTVSNAQASARLLRGAEDTLIVDIDLYAHGGHYRTAATCFAGQPIGLTGHDTLARASAVVQGSLRIPVVDEQTSALRVEFRGMPQDQSEVEVLDPDGAVVDRIVNPTSGEREIAVEKRGVYLVRLSLRPSASAEGGGEARTRFSAQLRAVRLET